MQGRGKPPTTSWPGNAAALALCLGPAATAPRDACNMADTCNRRARLAKVLLLHQSPSPPALRTFRLILMHCHHEHLALGRQQARHKRQQAVDDASATRTACPRRRQAATRHLFIRGGHIRRVEHLRLARVQPAKPARQAAIHAGCQGAPAVRGSATAVLSLARPALAHQHVHQALHWWQGGGKVTDHNICSSHLSRQQGGKRVGVVREVGWCQQ